MTKIHNITTVLPIVVELQDGEKVLAYLDNTKGEVYFVEDELKEAILAWLAGKSPNVGNANHDKVFADIAHFKKTQYSGVKLHA